jgi:hypothetical protein
MMTSIGPTGSCGISTPVLRSRGEQVVAAAAKVVRDVLRTLGLESWVKTTGGRGLHVVVPIKRSHGWSECLQFARDVSEAIERTTRSIRPRPPRQDASARF